MIMIFFFFTEALKQLFLLTVDYCKHGDCYRHAKIVTLLYSIDDRNNNV